MNALAEIGDSRAIMPLIKIFEHSRDNNDKLNAIKALGKFQDERVRSLVEQSSEATDEVGEEARTISQRWNSSDS
jgi:HEAT repeat protein